MARHPVSSGPWLEEMEYRPLTDAEIRKAWRMAHGEPQRTWRDRVRRWATPRWVLDLRRIIDEWKAEAAEEGS